jgi:hypothetical protein
VVPRAEKGQILARPGGWIYQFEAAGIRLGGMRYPAGTVPAASEDRQRHFGPHWPWPASAKRRYDPAGIARPPHRRSPAAITVHLMGVVEEEGNMPPGS